MTQQIFTLQKDTGRDILLSHSRFGTESWHEAVAIQPGTSMEFLIFNGVGGTNFGFSVAAWPASKRGYVTYTKNFKRKAADSSTTLSHKEAISSRNAKGTVVNTFAGDSVHNNPEARIARIGGSGDIWPGNNWGEDTFYDDGWGDVSEPDPRFPGGSGGGGGGYSRASFDVQLYRPNEKEPIQTWQVEAEERVALFRRFKFPKVQEGDVFVRPDLKIMKKYGWWKCVVTLTGEEAAFIQFRSTSFLKKVQFKEKVFAKRWLEHALWNVLSLLTPQVSIEGDTVLVSLAKELEHGAGIAPINVSLQSSLINSHVQLTAIKLETIRGKDVHIFLKERRDLAYNNYIEEKDKPLSGEQIVEKQNRILKKKKIYEKAKLRYENSLKDFSVDRAVLQIIPVFVNPNIELSYSLLGVTVEFDEMPNIFFGFSKNSLFSKLEVYAEINYELKDVNILEGILVSILDWAVEWKEEKGLFEFVNEEIESILKSEKNSDLVHKYLFAALSKAAGQNAIVEDLTGNAQGWVVKFYDAPEHPDPSKPYISKPDLDAVSPDELGLGAMMARPLGIAAANGLDVNFDTSVNPDSTISSKRFLDKDIPETFKLGKPVHLKNLDKVETIVVIMMENRSYDHFFGDLSRVFPNKGYKGFDLNFTNPPAGNFKDPIPVCKASDAFFPSSTVTPISPEHSHYHVMCQISDGSYDTKKPKSENDLSKLGLMQGFTKDILARFSENAGNINYPHEAPRFESPQVVMTYYQEQQLPFYYHLARNFKILDQWFAAHPGATWPNRIATHTGKLVSLENFPLDDKRLGFLKEKTIFDVLTSYGIDWKFMESNISILRLFDKYRTDDTNVIPLHRGPVITNHKFEISDQDFVELDNLLAQDKLPRVLFIEPRFSDAPPLGLATDDLAPADIANGQEFVKTIYEKLLNSPHWNKTAMLITYDEHGGFFDHVPPPGTPLSTMPNPVPPIYVDPEDPKNEDKWGPTHLGVRVPTILVSPFVKTHSVGHTVFDHTSILKTILVHNRSDIPSNVLTSFGERVNQANHIGMELDNSTPHIKTKLNREIRKMKIWTKVKYRRTRVGNLYGRYDGIEKHDYHECLRTLFMP